MRTTSSFLIYLLQKQYLTQQRRKANIDALVNFYVVMSKARNYNQSTDKARVLMKG